MVQNFREICRVPFIALSVVSFSSWGTSPLKLFYQERLVFEAWYPYANNGSYLMQIFIPVQQMTVTTQMLSGLTFDLLMNAFYLYPGIRQLALSREFTQTVGSVDLKEIVKAHQRILR